AEQIAAIGASIRAGNYAPDLSVPVLDQRVIDATNVCGMTDGPDVAASWNARDRRELAAGSYCRNGDKAPYFPIPLLRHSLADTGWIAVAANSPDIFLRNYGDRDQLILRALVRAGNDFPGRAAPMFRQRLVIRVPHRPDIVAICSSDPVQHVTDPWIRAGIHDPVAAFAERGSMRSRESISHAHPRKYDQC